MNRALLQMSYTLRKEKQTKDTKIIINFIFAFIIINILFKFFLFPVRQCSVTMEPDVPKNSLVMVSPALKNPDRGDVVLIKPNTKKTNNVFKKIVNPFVTFFTAQQVSLLDDNEIPGTKSHLRRIVGLPGDTIYMNDFLIYVKPAEERHFLTEYELADNTYTIKSYKLPIDWDNSIAIKNSFTELKLEQNEYFVLGDNRLSSFDSRIWGIVKHKDITGTALACYFPFKNFKKLF